MFQPHVSQAHATRRLAPYSTGHNPRKCRVCGQSFIGLGTLCPIHRAAHARTRAFELQAQRAQSNQIINARAMQAKAAQPKRTEWQEELDA